ncbi:phosphatidylserine decarboxylase [Campylobacter troglodytis]|uniref:phosphatidylserine decarboxylase n=1 Tax=Campylobacter troglodytis TaxID=654363 RepID=UPI001156FB2A|nr:phosphatidylserine decarboxylase [Campylobacter troglodytis]TQR54096.1 phosphatidylserine decarboxylase [Campylobacter troglodytis]
MLFSKDISRLFGLIAGIKFPKWLQTKINLAYVKQFNIDLSEFKPLSEYESLNALFTRRLEKQRELEEGFISPCDATVFECGSAFKAQSELLAFSIKNNTYSINELLDEAYEKNELAKGCEYINLYLSPRDYHRYHAPCDLQILSASYVRGELFSVSAKCLEKISNLYSKNERVVLRCKSKDSLFWLVFVGALNVGKIRFVFDESIQTNAKSTSKFTKNYENLHFKKGDELGNFELGSTIVIIAQKSLLKFTVKTGASLKFSQKIAEFKQ